MTILKTSGTIVKLNTNSLGSGTFNMSENFMKISGSFVYGNNVPGAKILQINIGDSNVPILYGRELFANPSAGTTYNFTGDGYFYPNIATDSTFYIIVTILIA
jgi:hypothetical protein